MEPWAGENFCYLTTTGRRSGHPHTIEIWFGASELRGGRIYLLSGGGDRSDWVRNLMAEPSVLLRVGDHRWSATASLVGNADEERHARTLLAAKYQGWREGRPLSGWASTALPVAIDLTDPVPS
jgi:deazaflavin-dependent oxidoreductase (nitroreductase family)